jgi:hypothetical protein
LVVDRVPVVAIEVVVAPPKVLVEILAETGREVLLDVLTEDAVFQSAAGSVA